MAGQRHAEFFNAAVTVAGLLGPAWEKTGAQLVATACGILWSWGLVVSYSAMASGGSGKKEYTWLQTRNEATPFF
jgi:hypothetical protein